MAYFSLDFNEFDDDDDWWDSYYDYQDEKDAYWRAHYSKVHYCLPDSKHIRTLQLLHHTTRSNVLSKDFVVTYERLYNALIKIDGLFTLWQKRMLHEYTKEVKRPSDKIKEDDKTANCAEKNNEADKSKKEGEALRDEFLELGKAIGILPEENHVFHRIQNILSEYDDDEDEDYDLEGSYIDSDDDWESSLDEFFAYSDDELFMRDMQRRSRHDKSKKEAKCEAVRQYMLAAEKYYAAFPTEADAKLVSDNISFMKSWISNICNCKLSKYLGVWLPDLVMEKILRFLRDPYRGDLDMTVGFIAKTQKFIDVEKVRMRELYAALQDVHSLLFEIMFKSHCTSNTIYLKQYFDKLIDVAMRKMTVLDDLHSWLLGTSDNSGETKTNDFMSGVCYRKHIRESSFDFDYYRQMTDAYSCFDQNHVAVLVPNIIKDGFIRVYDAKAESCIFDHKLRKNVEKVHGIALCNDRLALVLEEDSFARMDVLDISTKKCLVSYKIWNSIKDGVKKLFFADVGGADGIVLQQQDSVVVISLGEDGISPKFLKEFEKVKSLAVKDNFMIVKDIETNDKSEPISSAKEAAEISKKVLGIKIFNLNDNSLIQTIEHPSLENSKSQYFGAPKWCVAVDTNPDSKRFILWNNELVQLWSLAERPKKLKDIDLGRRVCRGTKLVLNKNIIMIQNSQNSHDDNYDSIDLAEFLFYDIDTAKVCYFETFHSLWESPDSNVSAPGGPFFAQHMNDDTVILLHSSSSGGEIRVYQFNLEAEKILNRQVSELVEKRRKEERLRLEQEAEKKRRNEERMARRLEQRKKALEKKRKTKEKGNNKTSRKEEIRRIEKSGKSVEGVVTDWRGTYGFLEVPKIGSVFIHRSDISGYPIVSFGSKIQCKLKEQTVYTRPKAVSAKII